MTSSGLRPLGRPSRCLILRRTFSDILVFLTEFQTQKCQFYSLACPLQTSPACKLMGPGFLYQGQGESCGLCG